MCKSNYNRQKKAARLYVSTGRTLVFGTRVQSDPLCMTSVHWLSTPAAPAAPGCGAIPHGVRFLCPVHQLQDKDNNLKHNQILERHSTFFYLSLEQSPHVFLSLRLFTSANSHLPIISDQRQDDKTQLDLCKSAQLSAPRYQQHIVSCPASCEVGPPWIRLVCPT